MAIIYDKTLKRKYISGVANTDKKKTWDKNKNKGENDPKAGADIGKIVNLMAGDANLVSLSPSMVEVKPMLTYKFELDLDYGEFGVPSLWRAVRSCDCRILPV